MAGVVETRHCHCKIVVEEPSSFRDSVSEVRSSDASLVIFVHSPLASLSEALRRFFCSLIYLQIDPCSI
jgi:hypothetical protein